MVIKPCLLWECVVKPQKLLRLNNYQKTIFDYLLITFSWNMWHLKTLLWCNVPKDVQKTFYRNRRTLLFRSLATYATYVMVLQKRRGGVEVGWMGSSALNWESLKSLKIYRLMITLRRKYTSMLCVSFKCKIFPRVIHCYFWCSYKYILKCIMLIKLICFSWNTLMLYKNKRSKVLKPAMIVLHIEHLHCAMYYFDLINVCTDLVSD